MSQKSLYKIILSVRTGLVTKIADYAEATVTQSVQNVCETRAVSDTLVVRAILSTWTVVAYMTEFLERFDCRYFEAMFRDG